MIPEAVVVEEHARDHERARERATSRLVRARHVPDAEAPVVCKESLAARSRHEAEDRR
jgi:hypothetical protein